MRIGLMLPVGLEDGPGEPNGYAGIKAMAKQAESVGLDSIWMADHLQFPDGSPWEAWTTLTGLAEATSTIRLGTLVICTAFRPAGVLARMADTLQEVSDNRLVLGLGAGWHQPEFDAYGLPFDHLAGRFADALEIVSRMLREGKASVAGRFESVEQAAVHERTDWAAPPILVAAKSPRMLGLTARFADSWNPGWFGLPDDRFRTRNAALSQACEEIGRDPAGLERTVGIGIGEHIIDAPVPADPALLAEAFAAWDAQGVSEAICWPVPKTPAAVDLIAEAVNRFRG